MIKVYFDGACTPKNPNGTATWGFVIHDVGGQKIRGCGTVGSGEGMTNNVAEYAGLINALKWLKKNRVNLPIIQVYGDSNLVVKMSAKEWGFHHGKYLPHRNMPHLQLLLAEVHELAKGLQIMYDWIPRRIGECEVFHSSLLAKITLKFWIYFYFFHINYFYLIYNKLKNQLHKK